MDDRELKEFFIATIEEYFMPNPVPLAQKWEGGSMVFRAGGDQQDKDVPIDVFFKKLVSVRDALRVLEQKINTSGSISQTEKTNLQGYITKCYGSLTTFNILFRNAGDKFVGAGKVPGTASKNPGMTMSEAKAKLGLNEHGRNK